MYTEIQVQQLMVGMEAALRKAAEPMIREVVALTRQKWEEAIAGGGGPPPQNMIEIPVIYMGSSPSGVTSVDLHATILWAKLQPIAAGTLPGAHNPTVNSVTPDTFKSNGWNIIGCGLSPRILYSIVAVQNAPVIPSDFTWTRVWLNEVDAHAEVVLDPNGSMRIEVKEAP